MKITNVSCRSVNMKKVCALASITIDDAIVVHDLRIVKGKDGFFVAMPSRVLPSGDFKDIAHPITTECRENIQKAVLSHYVETKTIEENKASPLSR